MKKHLIFLLVNDPVQGSFLKYQFASCGFKNIMLFKNQSECIYSLKRNSVPDFIIADTSVKGMTDIEFLRLVKNEVPGARVVFISLEDNPSHMPDLLEQGASDFIQKNGNRQDWVHELIANLRYLIREEYPTR